MADAGLQISLRSAGPVIVEGDAALIHRMIGNLLHNEIKHLPSGCMVTIRLQTDDGIAALEVEDDGPGFAPELRPHLFESRVKGSQSNGHGLGLAFVGAVARAHAGTAAASNREEGGARITVMLPVAGSIRSAGTAEIKVDRRLMHSSPHSSR